MQTSLNQSGHAIEIVAMDMLFYMSVSLSIGLEGVSIQTIRVFGRSAGSRFTAAPASALAATVAAAMTARV